MRGKRQVDLSTDPPPDLAIEIEISRSALGRMAIYASLGIPEVWRFDGESLQVHVLQDGGTYLEVPTSRCLPQLPVQEIVPFLQPDEKIDEASRIRQFIDWAGPFFNSNTP